MRKEKSQKMKLPANFFWCGNKYNFRVPLVVCHSCELYNGCRSREDYEIAIVMATDEAKKMKLCAFCRKEIQHMARVETLASDFVSAIRSRHRFVNAVPVMPDPPEDPPDQIWKGLIYDEEMAFYQLVSALEAVGISQSPGVAAHTTSEDPAPTAEGAAV